MNIIDNCMQNERKMVIKLLNNLLIIIELFTFMIK